MKKILLIIFIIISLVSSISVAVEMLVPAQAGNRIIEIEIPKGATFKQVVEILYNQKLIKDKNLFLLIGRLTGADRKIRAGYYSIWGNMSPLDIFKIIRKGQIIEYEIKIVEGDSLLEISEKLSETGIMTKEDFMKLSKEPDFLAFYDIESNSIEGYIFPDTYFIPKGVLPEDAIGSMIDRMREKYSHELLARTEEIGMTEREVLTLASIIEKEAVVDSERPLISAVYRNRLKKNMLLQADPTAIYGIKSSREKITTKDLQRKTPYNTYGIKGLPPGPIASPGIKSIIAALYPADVSYIYFVSNNDGSHQFSVTAKEHLAAVKSYREKKQIENKGETEKGTEKNGSS
jgi:UPF0755 protein